MGKVDGAKSVECENPRTVTRGLNSQMSFGAVGVHWLRGTVHELEKAWLIEKFQVLFGAEYESHEFGFWNFDRHLAWPCGAMILYHSTQEGSDLTCGRIALEIPGKALEALPMHTVGLFMSHLARHGFQASRIDLFYDDPDRVITPRELYQRVHEPGLFRDDPLKWDIVGFRVINFRQTSTKDASIVHDEVSFGRRGSKGSGKYLRVYDKQLESDGENNSIRWELEVSGKYAKAVFDRLIAAFGDDEDDDGLRRALGRTLGGCVDFKHRTERVGDKNLSRCERYEFWETILAAIDRAKLTIERARKTVARAREWVGRQMIGTLQMLTKAFGPAEFCGYLVNECTHDDRIRQAHRRALAEFRRVGLDPPALAVQ